MKAIVNHLENKKVVRKLLIEDFDFLINKKLGIYGICLKKEVICANYKKAFSFRLNTQNITHPEQFTFLKFQKIIDIEYLKEYFQFNEDNPFAIYFIFLQLCKGLDINKENVVTQFPPLNITKEQKASLERLNSIVSKSQTGDILFTLDINSYVSQKISQIDYNQFSHMATVYDNGIFQEMTTSGLSRNNIADINPANYDIALYRIIDFKCTQDEKDKMIQFLDKMYEENYLFNWQGLFRAYLFRKYKAFKFLERDHPWKNKTAFDFIFSNKLKLIEYA